VRWPVDEVAMTPKFSLAMMASSLALIAPGAAQAAAHSHHASHSRTVSGTVLDASSRSHVVRVVTARGAVRSYRVAGALGRSVRRGARVRFSSTGAVASHLKVLSHVRSVTFLARVVRSRDGLVVSAGDGSRVRLGAASVKVAKHHVRKGNARAHAAADIPITIHGLIPGQAVLVTMSLSPAGQVVGITIDVINPPMATGGPATPQQLSGTVVAVDEESGVFTVADSTGTTTDFTMSDALLAADDQLPSQCDIVSVTYHADPSSPDQMVADTVTTTGTDTTSPACSDSSGGDQEATGVVTGLDPVAGTITVTTADGTKLTMAADSGLLDGISLGDRVDVMYAQAADGSLVADNVAPVDASAGTTSGD
jgi:hypothetical protein